MQTSLIKEYNLSVDVVLVRSDQSWADLLTIVPQRWLNDVQKEIEPMEPLCVFAMVNLNPAHLTEVH